MLDHESLYLDTSLQHRKALAHQSFFFCLAYVIDCHIYLRGKLGLAFGHKKTGKDFAIKFSPSELSCSFLTNFTQSRCVDP